MQCDCAKQRQPQNSFKTESNPPPLNCIFNAIARSRHILRIPLRLKAPPTSLLVTPWTPQKTDRKCRLHMQRDCAKQRQPQNSSKTESTPHYSIAYATRLHKKDTTSESTPHYTHSPNETSPSAGSRQFKGWDRSRGGWCSGDPGRSVVYATPLYRWGLGALDCICNTIALAGSDTIAPGGDRRWHRSRQWRSMAIIDTLRLADQGVDWWSANCLGLEDILMTVQ
jgi:hypothetical protein